MLTSTLIHPEISAALAAAGHHGRILIADGNYPASSKRGPHARLVSLNLMPGVVNCTQVLRAILAAVPIEEINTMMFETSGPYALQSDPPVWAEYEKELAAAGSSLKLKLIEKWAFYDAVVTPDHVLTIQTGDQQRYANILLSIGVRMD